MNFERDGELVAPVTDGNGWYADGEDYLRDLFRRDVERGQSDFEAFKSELQAAFAEPESSYRYVTAEDVMARNKLRD